MLIMDKFQYKNKTTWLKKAEKSLRIIIVGAGIGGLTAAIGEHFHPTNLIHY
jgi:hypothetical protein